MSLLKKLNSFASPNKSSAEKQAINAANTAASPSPPSQGLQNLKISKDSTSTVPKTQAPTSPQQATSFLPSTTSNTAQQQASTAPVSSGVATTPSDLLGKPKQKFSIQDFNIDRTLGTGSFGRVHLVKLKSSGRYYAMKVLKKADVVKMKQVEHTINEKNTLENIQFPFMVNMLGSFQDSRNLYLVLEYIAGGELFTFLRRSGRFPNHVARFYAAEVTLAFEYLHSKNVVYRDLKPENLLLDSHGHIRITDFGFAKLIPENITWTLCGTPDYLAPEIIQSKGYGKAVDWWALGILIYEMVAGHPPFFDDDHTKLYEKILQCKPKFAAHFDPLAKDLVKKLLTPDLTKRFGNLKAGAADIKMHKWFAPIDWVKLKNLQITPPYVPPSNGEGDASNFDRYPEDHEPYGVAGPDPYKDFFKEF